MPLTRRPEKAEAFPKQPAEPGKCPTFSGPLTTGQRRPRRNLSNAHHAHSSDYATTYRHLHLERGEESRHGEKVANPLRAQKPEECFLGWRYFDKGFGEREDPSQRRLGEAGGGFGWD